MQFRRSNHRLKHPLSTPVAGGQKWCSGDVRLDGEFASADVDVPDTTEEACVAAGNGNGIKANDRHG